MLILSTDNPKVTTGAGDHIIVDIKSGRDVIQIALTLNHALYLQGAMRQEITIAMTEGFASATTADVVPFPPKRKAGRR